MDIEGRFKNLEDKIDAMKSSLSSSRSWDLAKLPDWPVEKFYNPETRSIIVEREGNFYLATLLNAGVLISPQDKYKHIALWFHQGGISPEPPNDAKPYTKDDQRIKPGALPLPLSFVLLVDKQNFDEKTIKSYAIGSFKTEAKLYDKYDTFDRIIPGNKDTGMFFGKDGSILIKGSDSEINMGPDGILIDGKSVQMGTTNQSEGGLMVTNPLRFLPSFAVLPLPNMLPNIDLALKAAALSGTIVDTVKLINNLKELV